MTEIKTFQDWLPEIDFSGFLWPVLVAGGALRDSWFDKPVKDIDVFIGVAKTTLSYVMRDGGTTIKGINLFYKGIDDALYCALEEGAEYEYATSNFLSLRCPDRPGLNIILYAVAETSSDIRVEHEKELAAALFEIFPCSISRIAWSPRTDAWFIHDSFKKSLETKVITFPRSVTGKYLNKIYPKYDEMEGAWE